MTGLPGIDNAVEIAKRVWRMEPRRNVRIPVVEENREPVTVHAIWTDYGLRPSATNLAFMVQAVPQQDMEQWKQWLRDWPIRAGLLVSDDMYLLQYYEPFGTLETLEIEPASLAVELTAPRSRLFTPKGLAEFRTGQLSLADLEESISENSFSFILRQRAELDKAFQEAIQGALEEIGVPNQRKHPQSIISSRTEIAGHAIRVAIAYLAARILEDKGFFGSEIPTNDPRILLNRTVPRANGFFKKALRESLPHLSEQVLGKLAVNLGSRISFALVDHKDVGLLYERAIKELPREIKGRVWTDLQRHYTPVALAERMLELLPLERLRPEERVIFDPAAGSGSLLLAATSRLAGMSDIPENINERKSYLERHVAGNDLDQYADLITQLRYTLARESLGEDVAFPFPSHFSQNDYKDLNKENIGIKPRVIVANPPFAEDGNVQRATKFIEKALSWLEEDAQFAFVLPQSFLTGTTHGISKARELLNNNCRILEVWQYPEKTVGIDAQQAVCVVLGSISSRQLTLPIVTRAVFSRAKPVISNARNTGFLGNTWISKLDSKPEDWTSVTAPPPTISVPTIPLGEIFYVFNGVNPGKTSETFSECPSGTNCKLYWQMQWRDTDRLWADPTGVPKEKRWIKYDSTSLEGPRLKNEQLFDIQKILVGRKVNRGSVYPLAAQLDTTGLCPDNNIFCILPFSEVKKRNKGYKHDKSPKIWDALTHEHQRLWLLGILSSKLGNALSLIGRKSHEITVDAILKLPLPLTVDVRIILITREIIQRDQRHSPIPELNDLREQLDKIVEESYGNPHWMKLKRTEVPPELEEWKLERTKATFTVFGQVLEISKDNTQIYLYLSGLLDDNREEWLPILPEMPGWALDGTVFEAELSEDVETFEELAKRPWAIRRFRHTPRPYLTDDELREELGLEEVL
ncbi:N-6 DNA methylase [Trichocoleus sp. DQ-A3]|uniref:N-6 DNA methylase n=1 Tax=Cyanophyceae TaxID=3028117 RepID=UPI0016897A5F|nr:N-6 DNA methylase [Coleofasciculus sp. FACHB-125]MBD1903755.1 N-6 DNA methylase [Coleofasciculus sp. FACHB-125]